jgi:hypothetical protein
VRPSSACAAAIASRGATGLERLVERAHERDLLIAGIDDAVLVELVDRGEELRGRVRPRDRDAARRPTLLRLEGVDDAADDAVRGDRRPSGNGELDLDALVLHDPVEVLDEQPVELELGDAALPRRRLADPDRSDDVHPLWPHFSLDPCVPRSLPG